MYTLTQLKMGHKVLIVISLFCCVNAITEAFGEVMVFEQPLVEIDVCQQICSNKQLNLNEAFGPDTPKARSPNLVSGVRLGSFNLATAVDAADLRVDYRELVLSGIHSSDKIGDFSLNGDNLYFADCGTFNDNLFQDGTPCLTGCSEMMQLQRDAWLYYIEQHGDKIQVEVTLVSDPALGEQNLGDNGVYKIPLTYLRSMPIQQELTEIINGKSWPPCTHTHDIPRWVVGLIAAVLIVMTVYVSCLLPSRPNNSLLIETSQLESGHGDPDRCNHQEMMKLLSGMNVEKQPHTKKAESGLEAEDKLVTVNEFFIDDFHTNVVAPPKYSLYPDCEDV